jgi:hypothetical protein
MAHHSEFDPVGSYNYGGFGPQFKFSGIDMNLGFCLNHVDQYLMYTPHVVVYHMRTDNDHSIENKDL